MVGIRKAVQMVFGVVAKSFERGAGHHSDAFATTDERATTGRDPGRRRRGGVEQLRRRRFERG